MLRLIAAVCLLLLPAFAHAAEADLYCLTGTSSTGAPIFLPASATNPCPVTGSGGGGGAVTVADGADVTEGAIADAAATQGGTGTVSAKLRTTTSLLNDIKTNTAASTPAGSAIIGKVGIDQTTPGTTNGVVINSGTVTVTCANCASAAAATPLTILSAASNNSTSIKASPGTLTSFSFLQTTTTLMDVRFYDTASAPTCSSATGMKLNFVIQSNAITPGGSFNLGTNGITFTSGIGICITGANANNDNTNAATGLNVILGYI